MDKKERIHVFYTGMVQGVGFRFTAERIAINLGIAGWVKNLTNGQVEVVAEGSKEKLEDFLAQINKYFDRYIRDADVGWQSATGEFEGFDISF